ncbi:MAG: hypothetical protein IH845_04040 [Nanoarchaeota archaeon]|nr:hypothetical protein [Nanoarchaeota archaeon]
MKNMKKYVLLMPVFAAMLLLTVGLVSAGSLIDENNIIVELNGVVIGDTNQLSSFAGDVVPVKIIFDALEDARDVEVLVSVRDGRDHSEAVTGLFNIEADKQYTMLLSLRIPSNFDGTSRDLTLNVEINGIGNGTDFDKDYNLRVQRRSYTIDVLSVDYTSTVSAGDLFSIAVVIENNGFNDVEDNYVVVSIPALDISVRGYVGDLDANEDYSKDNHEEDAIEEVVYLRIPEDAVKGVYDMEIRVYNDDSSMVVVRPINIEGSASTVIAADKSKDLNAGETVTYELVIVNSGSSVRVFEISSVSGESLFVSVPSVVAVGPDSSEVIEVLVTANAGASIGTYTFTVNVDDTQVVFGANVVGEDVSASTVALTVVLVIIFVVLLAVLVVLLTRKEKPMEEVETSYY